MPPKGSTIGHQLFNIDVARARPALARLLKSPNMELLMDVLGTEAVALYRAKVAKRTGALARTAASKPRIGGHEHDRWIGVMTFGGEGAVSTWMSPRNPNPNDLFFYGVLHDAGDGGSPPSGMHFPAHNDGKAVRDSMVGGK